MPTLTWLTREHDLKTSRNAPYRLLEEVSELSYFSLRHDRSKKWES